METKLIIVLLPHHFHPLVMILLYHTPSRSISLLAIPDPSLATVFISELTCRAWLIAETNKRRTLQKADVANAIAASDMFDFLIDIIPRDDGSTAGSGAATAATAGTGTGTGSGMLGGVGGGVINGQVPELDDGEEEIDEDDDERVFTEFVRQEEIG
jgi:hypothetical protein